MTDIARFFMLSGGICWLMRGTLWATLIGFASLATYVFTEGR